MDNMILEIESADLVDERIWRIFSDFFHVVVCDSIDLHLTLDKDGLPYLTIGN